MQTHDEQQPNAAARPGRAGRGAWIARGLLVVWAPLVLLVLSSLMTGHWAPLPTPDAADARFRAALAPLAAPGAWTLAHVLYADCRCSRRVFDYVAERSSPDDLHEVVLLVGGRDEDLEAACEARGMRCVTLTQQQLEERFGVEAAPLFVVADPDGQPVYVGGYTDRKQALDHRDLDVVARLRRGEEVAPLPVFGCGVSDSLQDALDPFGIKY